MDDVEQITAFGEVVELKWQPINIEVPDGVLVICESERYYLHIKGVARYLVLPQQNLIVIEKEHADISFAIVATWLFGTVFAYLLQYKGYLVLHGSAIAVQDKVMIFSGESGAGKSTLASAMVDRGYHLVTDDVVVIKYNHVGQLVVVPGPAKVKLWQDALVKFGLDSEGLDQVVNKENKYEVPIENRCWDEFEVAAFYELNPQQSINQIQLDVITGLDKLHLLKKNTYRYNMLKPLNKLVNHFYDCSKLAQQINVVRVSRPQQLYLLTELAEIIEDDFLNGE